MRLANINVYQCGYVSFGCSLSVCIACLLYLIIRFLTFICPMSVSPYISTSLYVELLLNYILIVQYSRTHKHTQIPYISSTVLIPFFIPITVR